MPMDAHRFSGMEFLNCLRTPFGLYADVFARIFREYRGQSLMHVFLRAEDSSGLVHGISEGIRA